MTGKDEETAFTDKVRQFDFCGESIDTSLRKLLAQVQLPKEAQQIDRAMEEFATRYHECNPTLVDKSDAVYAVAFSILLLHTDAHNKNVKKKMDKDTFIRRTKIIEGGENVPAEILDIMYDNIVLSEFTYAKDTITRPERSNSWFSKFMSDSTIATSGSNTINPPNIFADLGPRLEQLMPAENTVRYKKDAFKQIPIVDVHFSLLTAKTLCLGGVRSKHEKNNNENNNNTFNIRVTKAGLLDRKHDLMPGTKRATARSWRPFGIILSGSQIILFSDLTSYQAWLDKDTIQRSPRRNSSFPHSVSSLSGSASNLSLNHGMSSTTSLYTENSAKIPVVQKLHLQPVQIISLSYAVCIYDETYTKYPHVFRLITGDGNQYLLRAENNEEMEDWMLKINYAASLKTTGVGVKSFKRRVHDSQDTKFDIERQKRQEEAKEKAQELSDRIEEQIRSLDRELQLRYNLLVLVPVQKSTRDRLIGFADMVGERIRHKRIELQRLECYRDYLESELAWCALSQQGRKLSLPVHMNGKPSKGINESIRSLSHLLLIPSSTSTSSNSSTSTTLSNAVSLHSQSDQDTKIPTVSFTKSVIDSKKVMDMEKVMRRRSQSNPILPNEKLLQPPKTVRERSGSEDSSIKEDDSLSVIIIHEQEGTEQK